MFRNNIAFKRICAIILFITMGVSQVSLEIKNVDLDELKKNNYLLRFNGDGLPANIENSVRVSLGPPKQTKEFLKCLELSLNDLKAQ